MLLSQVSQKYHTHSLFRMSSQVSQGSLLEVLKKKMRSLKDELESSNQTADEFKVRVNEEARRREEVGFLIHLSIS